MEGQKLQLVKESANFILNQLSSRDKFGLVEYNTSCREVFPLSRTSEGFKPEAARVIKKLKAESRTNLSGGLFLGFEQQQKNQFLDWEPEEEVAMAVEGEQVADATDAMSEQSSFVEVDAKSDTFSEASFVEMEPNPNLDATPTAPTPAEATEAPLTPKVMKRARFSPRASTQALRISRAPLPPAGLSDALFGGREAPSPKQLDAEAVKSIFLFTDGLANEGLTRKEKLVETLSKLLQSAEPTVCVHTFGFGNDHSPELLGELAKAGGGTYYYIEKEEGLATAFADALGGLLSVAAQNVTLEFVPAAGVRCEAVHTSFKVSKTAEGRDAVAVGDLYSEEGKDVLFDVELPAVTGEAARGCTDFSVGVVRVKYLDVEGCVLAEEELDCVVRRVGEVPEGVEADAAVAVQRARVETAKAMQAAEAAASSGNRVQAATSLRTAMERLTLVQRNQSLRAPDRELVNQLRWDCEEAAANVQTEEAYTTRGNKLLWAKMRAHDTQRACALEDVDYEAYEAGQKAAPVPRNSSHTYATPTQMCFRGIARKNTSS